MFWYFLGKSKMRRKVCSLYQQKTTKSVMQIGCDREVLQFLVVTVRILSV